MGNKTPSEIESLDTTHAAVGYFRVSDEYQVKQGYSLGDQRDSLLQEAESRGIPVVKTVEDRGESGTDFDREGIREIRYLASHENISYILVDEVDRIGRHAVEVLSYLYELREECGVTIITNEVGELDVTDYHDLVYIVMRALSSQSTNETRKRRSIAGRVQRFLEKNWSSAFNSVPLGYVETEDGWIATDPDEVSIVQEAVQNFLDADVYRAYQETLEETSDLPNGVDTGKIRRFLRRPLYIGRPTTNYVDRTRNDDSKMQTTVPDPSLRILSDETYEAVQNKLQRVSDAYGNCEDNTTDIEALVQEFGPEAVVAADEIIQVRCPECDGKTNSNGQRDLKSRTVHNYVCKSCGRQRKFPTQTEMDALVDANGGDTPTSA